MQNLTAYVTYLEVYSRPSKSREDHHSVKGMIRGFEDIEPFPICSLKKLDSGKWTIDTSVACRKGVRKVADDIPLGGSPEECCAAIREKLIALAQGTAQENTNGPT